MNSSTFRRIAGFVLATLAAIGIFFLFEYFDKGNRDIKDALTHATMMGCVFGVVLYLISLLRQKRKEKE